MVNSHTILLISLGRLNGLILEFLARTPGIGRITIATRNTDYALSKANLARMGAVNHNLSPEIQVVFFDFNKPDAPDILSRLSADVALAAPSLQSWWVLEQLPAAAAIPLRQARFGAWLPLQLAPMQQLMYAWQEGGLNCPLLAAPYPDVVNPILARLGLAPTAGIGNLDEIVPKLRWMVSEWLGCHAVEVTIRLVAHHALEPYVYAAAPCSNPPPYLIQITVEGRDITGEIDVQRLLFYPYPLPHDLDFHFLTADSALRLVCALLDPLPVPLHVPAPEGLPGGYPVLVGEGKITLDLPPGCPMAKAIEINNRSARWDGIAAIGSDGRVTFTGQTHQILRDTLGYDCPVLLPAEIQARAEELKVRFAEYVKRVGGKR